jgi:hypothetical protein
MISRGDSRLCVKNDDLIMYLILDDSNAFPMLFSEHMIQECCLARAEKTSDNSDRNARIMGWKRVPWSHTARSLL